MRIGDIVKRRPKTFGDPEKKVRQVMEGEVVYIHPQGRYHIVEFQLPGGKVREAFLGVGN